MLHTAAEGETATKDNKEHKEGVRVLGRVAWGLGRRGEGEYFGKAARSNAVQARGGAAHTSHLLAKVVYSEMNATPTGPRGRTGS